MKRTSIALAAAALVATMTAAPVMAQTTVTSSGRDGQTTCVGRAETNVSNFPITAMTTSSVTVTAPEVTWSQVLTRLGDRQPPTNSIISVNVFNAKTGASAGNSGAVGVISSSSQTYAGGSVTRTGLAEKTLYYIDVDIGISGGQGQLFARRCFMTGGTYTMNVAPGSTDSAGTFITSGCFAITPRTPEDVRNCWCGRESTLPLFGDATDNTNFRRGIGCR